MPQPQKLRTDKALIALANEIIALETRYGARAAAKAGHRILERLYGGDTAAFRANDPTKELGLTALARLLGRSRTRVWALVAVAIVYDALPIDLRDRLTPSHHEALYGATDVERERLAREAVGAGLTVTELRARIHGDILPDPDDASPPDRSGIARAERVADRVERDVERAAPEDHPDLARRLDALIARYTDIRQRLPA